MTGEVRSLRKSHVLFYLDEYLKEIEASQSIKALIGIHMTKGYQNPYKRLANHYRYFTNDQFNNFFSK